MQMSDQDMAAQISKGRAYMSASESGVEDDESGEAEQEAETSEEESSERGNIKDPGETKPAVQAWKPRFKM